MKEKKRENKTKYGEEIPSMYNWLPIDKQKQKAKKLADVTKDKKD